MPRAPLNRRNFLLRVASIALLSCLAPAAWAADDSASAPSHVRVTWKESPSSQATISWSTVEPGDKHRVLLRADGDDDDKQRTIASTRDGEFSGSEGKLYYHHARLDDLEPATKYEIRLESDGEESQSYYFLTAPDDDRPFKLLFGGDSRSGLDARKQMNEKLAAMVADDSDILALVHGGDYIASGLSFEQWQSWLTDHELTIGDDGRLLPIIPARGNHDVGELFNEIFDFPPRDTNYYALSIGSLLRLVTLNTEISVAGTQANWLEDELAASRPSHPWLVVQYHKPAYPAVKGPSGARTHWVPLFEKYNVDLACEADGHAIKRTVPIRDEQLDPTGVVYIGEGGLGVGQRSPNTAHWYLQEPGKAGKGHHVQLLSFDNEHLEYQSILIDGEVFDRHTLEVRQ